MLRPAFPSGSLVPFDAAPKPLGKGGVAGLAALTALTAFVAFGGSTLQDGAALLRHAMGKGTASVAAAPASVHDWMLDPNLRFAEAASRQAAPRFEKIASQQLASRSAFIPALAPKAQQQIASLELPLPQPAQEVAPRLELAAPAPDQAPDSVQEALPVPEILPSPEARRLAEAIPLPVPRPRDLDQMVAQADARLASRQASRRGRNAAPPAAVADNRTFIEKLFNLDASPAAVPQRAMGYASLEASVGGSFTQPSAPAPLPAVGGGTAIYNITQRVVIMPNGERLEAHSGLGPKLDDPRFVHVRMNGATPPGVYNLTEREALFHGVRAIRLNPVGGSRAVFGRAGLLAHTYMLGPNGDSNGCVSFRDYNKFLQAFLRGEVRRLVVVSGTGQDRMPTIASGTEKSRRWASRSRGA